MDLSNFVEKAKELNVLGFKVSQNGEALGEWHSEPECRRGEELQRAVYDLICSKL
mgnify:CR=1 FL=1